MRAHQATYPVKTMCRVLDVSRSGYYAWLKRPPSARAVANGTLLERIEEIHEESDSTYGAPRIHAELKAEGDGASRNRVARVMREAGIEGVSRRKWTKTTVRGEDARPAPDLVDRDFRATGPDQLWVADITYIPTWAGFLYLAIVLDVWSRRVVGWAMETHLRTELVLKALDMAAWRRKPVGVIHHSDQGTQYTSVAFGRRCEEMGVRPSTGSVGDAYDNAMAESFFATLECELIDRRSFRSHAEGRMAVFQYIEGWYNPWRRHSGLAYESPMSFERKHGHAGTSRSESPLSPLGARDSETTRKTTRQDAPGSTIAVSSDLRVPLLSDAAAAGDSSTTGSVPGLASLYFPAP
jgi:putative transposase